jgi:hypothetical protein
MLDDGVIVLWWVGKFVEVDRGLNYRRSLQAKLTLRMLQELLNSFGKKVNRGILLVIYKVTSSSTWVCLKENRHDKTSWLL